jgi:hypothetical protein
MCKYRLEQPASKIAPSIPWYATPPFADNRVAAAALSVESYQLYLVVMPTRIPSRPLLTPLSRRESLFRRHSQEVWCAATLDCLVLASSSGFVRKRHAGSHLQGDILLSVHQTRAKNKYLTKIRLDPKASHKSILRSGEAEMERVSPFVAQPATPNWRRAALIFTAALAAVALATHVVAVSSSRRNRADCQQMLWTHLLKRV